MKEVTKESVKEILNAIDYVIDQTHKFNEIAGKGYDDDFQLKLTKEEHEELSESLLLYGVTSSEFKSELVDCLVTSCYSEGSISIIGKLKSQIESNFDLLRFNVMSSSLSDIIIDNVLQKYDDHISYLCSDCVLLINDLHHKIDNFNFFDFAKWKTQSNLSKFSIFEDTSEFYIKCHNHAEKLKGDRYRDVSWEIVEYEGIKYVVWKSNEGKILKGFDFIDWSDMYNKEKLE